MEIRQLLLLANMNIGLHKDMKAFAVQGRELYRKHTYVAPGSGTRNFVMIPIFKE